MNPKVCTVQLVFENNLGRRIRSDSIPSPLAPLSSSGTINERTNRVLKSKNKDDYIPILLGIFDSEEKEDNLK